MDDLIFRSSNEISVKAHGFLLKRGLWADRSDGEPLTSETSEHVGERLAGWQTDRWASSAQFNISHIWTTLNICSGVWMGTSLTLPPPSC